MSDEKEKITKEIKISHYLPYVGSFIIFLGVARLIFFYSSFGISITNFIEFTEIITSFLDIIVFSVLIFAYSVLQGFLLHGKTDIEETHKLRKSIIEENKILKRFWLHLKNLQELFFGGLLIIVLYYIWHFFNESITYSALLWCAVIYLVCAVLLIITVEIERRHHQFNSTIQQRRFMSTLFNSLLFIGIILLFAKIDVDSIKNNKTTYGIEIILDNDEKIVSDSTNYYIGKTQNYFFIFHEHERTTDVIPMKRVKRMTMGRRNQPK